MGHFLGFMKIWSWDWKSVQTIKSYTNVYKANHLAVHTHTKPFLGLIMLTMITLQLAGISSLKLKLSSWCISCAFERFWYRNSDGAYGSPVGWILELQGWNRCEWSSSPNFWLWRLWKCRNQTQVALTWTTTSCGFRSGLRFSKS